MILNDTAIEELKLTIVNGRECINVKAKNVLFYFECSYSLGRKNLQSCLSSFLYFFPSDQTS